MSHFDTMQALYRIPEYLENPSALGNGGPKLDVFKPPVFVKPHKRIKSKRLLFPELSDGRSSEIKTSEFISIHDLYRPWLREGKYLTLEIDLTKNTEEILGEIKGEIHYFKKYHVHNPKTRVTKTFYLPWKVYDLHKEGKNLSQIARELSGRGGYASGNPKLMAAYKEVKRAYDKACEMLSQVEKDIKAIIHPN